MMKGKPVRKKLGMTGELTLTGRVLPIGGLKEKTIAARRAGLKVLIFPEGNRKDFDELPDYLKEGLEVHFAKEYKDVYKVAFGKR
jgi:ATP-dependent Lon protease